MPLEATDNASPADTDRADRTREPATRREFSSSVPGPIKAREPQPKLEQGHQEPLYVRVYCVIMPICLVSILVTILWYLNVFDQVAITFGNHE